MDYESLLVAWLNELLHFRDSENLGFDQIHITRLDSTSLEANRKGATRAFGPGFEGLPPEYRPLGQPVLAPGSMGTESWILLGTEANEALSYGSTCHGAGRVMSRHKAKRMIRGRQLKEGLESQGVRV